MKRSTVAIVTLSSAALLAILWEPLVGSFLYRERNRGEVRALYEKVQIGMSTVEVTREIRSDRYPHLRLDVAPDSWIAWAPEEFGAQNWVLLIRAKEDRVVSVWVRTSDSFSTRPQDAPPDKNSTSLNSTVPSNKGLHQTKRVGVPASRAVVEARPAGEPGCSTDLR